MGVCPYRYRERDLDIQMIYRCRSSELRYQPGKMEELVPWKMEGGLPFEVILYFLEEGVVLFSDLNLYLPRVF